MRRIAPAVVYFAIMFVIGAWAGDALRPPGSYAVFQSSDSVSGQLTASLPVNYVVPEPCGDLEDWQEVVYLDDLELIDGTYHGGAGGELIFGTDGNDKIFGGTGIDCIVGRGGDDEINGNGGADLLFGGPGDDRIFAAGSDGLLDGGDGNDFCVPRSIAVNCEGSGPSGLTATGHHSIPTVDLKWDPVKGAAAYSVYRSENVAGPYTKLASPKSPQYSDVGVQEDVTYFYFVTAVFPPNIESDPSEIRSASVPSLTPTPAPTTIPATQTPSPAPTATATATATPVLPTATQAAPTATPTRPPATATPSPTPTRTPAPPTSVPPTATSTVVN